MEFLGFIFIFFVSIIGFYVFRYLINLIIELGSEIYSNKGEQFMLVDLPDSIVYRNLKMTKKSLISVLYFEKLDLDFENEILKCIREINSILEKESALSNKAD